MEYHEHFLDHLFSYSKTLLFPPAHQTLEAYIDYPKALKHVEYLI